MTLILTQWPRQLVVREWVYAHELTHELDRWEPIDNQDIDAIPGLVTTDLVPWVLTWPEQAQTLLRNVLSYGLTIDNALLERASDELVVNDYAISCLWEPLWDGVFGGVATALPDDDVVVVTESGHRVQVETQYFGERFRPPDPLQVWPWLGPARAAIEDARMNLLLGVDLLPGVEEVDEALSKEPSRKIKKQGLIAIEAAASSWRTAKKRWSPPVSGPVVPAAGDGLPLISTGFAVFCHLESTSRVTPMRDVESLLEDAAMALDITAGPATEMVAEARRVEATNPSNSHVYLAWAEIAEAIRLATGSGQCLLIRGFPE